MYWSSGEWTDKDSANIPEIDVNYCNKNLRFVEMENEIYFTYDAHFPWAFTRFVLNYTGQFKQLVWVKGFRQWSIV